VEVVSISPPYEWETQPREDIPQTSGLRNMSLLASGYFSLSLGSILSACR
jgi:hypothetical protein